MDLSYRNGNIKDLIHFKELAIKSWGQYKSQLSEDNWDRLYKNLYNDDTYLELLNNATCLVCVTGDNRVIGMAFLVSSGNPTEIYDKSWCYIRFVTVDPDYNGLGIGRQLTKKCIQLAKENRENIIALHTSEIMNKARHIYESMGFTILREIDQRLGKRYWLYTMDLNKNNSQ